MPLSGTAMSASSTLPLEKWELKVRMGGSAKGSMPMSLEGRSDAAGDLYVPLDDRRVARRIPWVTRSVR